MEGIITDSFVRRLLHPGVESCSQRLALVLNREIDQRRGSPKRGSSRAGFEIVGTMGTAKGHVQVRVHVDSAGQNVLARGVNDLAGIFARQALANGIDFAAPDGDVGRVGVG